MVEEYELTPHHKLEELEKELDELKKHPLGSTSAGKNLLYAIETLNDNINRLIDIFKESAESIQTLPENTGEDSDMRKKLDELVDQNREIAEAIVSLADELKEHKDTTSKALSSVSSPSPANYSPKPAQHQFMPGLTGAPISGSTTAPGFATGIPDMPDLGPDFEMPSLNQPPSFGSTQTLPPMPEITEQKKGGFGLFKRK